MSLRELRGLDPAQIVDYILPVLLPKLPAMVVRAYGVAGGGGGDLAAHELAGPHHTGALADAQAPQFLKSDGSRPLTGNLPVANGITIDGVDLSAHAQDPDAHHAQVHGIVSGNHTAAGARWQLVGLTADNTLGLITPSSAPGEAAAILRTDAGGVLDLTELRLGSAMTLRSGGNVALAPDIQFSGSALLAAEGSLYVALDSDNSASGDALIVGHNGSSTTGFVEVYRLADTGRLTITAAAPTIATAGGSLLVDPAVWTVFADDKDMRSASHAAGFGGQGWRISWPQAGKPHLDMRSIYAETLEVTAFQADIMRVRIAEDFLTGGMAFTAADFVTPGVGGSVRVVFEDNPTFDGQLFLNGEWVLFNLIQKRAGLTVAQVWGQVSGYQDEAAVDGVGRQSWLFTLRSGPTGLTVPRSSIALAWGLSGQKNGYIHHSVLASAYGPWTRYATWSGANPYTPANRAYHVQVGNLRGLVDIGADRYGIAAGDNLAKLPTDAVNPFRGFTADNVLGLRLFNAAYASYLGAVQTVEIAATGNVRLGSDLAAAGTTTFSFTAATGALRLGPGTGGPSVHWSGSSLALRNAAGADVITLYGSGDSSFTGVMQIAAGGEIRQGTGAWGGGWTGLRVWNDGGVGRIGGYKNVNGAATLQWCADTSGELRAGGGVVAIASDGFGLARYATEAGAPIAGTEAKGAVAWWDDINGRTGAPLARIYAGRSSAGTGAVPSLSLEVDPANAAVGKRSSVWLTGSHPGFGNAPSLWLNNIYSVVGLPGIYPTRNPSTLAEAVQFSGSLQFQSHLLRDPNNAAIDIGALAAPFRAIYVGQIVADAISGATLDGQTWSYPGSMGIDPKAATDTTVQIANSGGGRADLLVDRNITLGGTVDGVDVASFKGLYDAHIADPNAHHSRQHGLDGADHTGTLAWSKVNKAGSSLADLAARAHGSLTGVGPNDHHAQMHVLATATGLGPDHTVNGLTPGHVLRASGATAAAFAQLGHGDLGGIGPDQHHAQVHGLDGADHTGTLAWSKVNKAGSDLADLQARAHGSLTGVGPNDHHAQVHGIVGADHTVTGAQWQLVGLTAADALGLITPSSAPGQAAAILRTDPNGLLTLHELRLGAAMTLYSGGNIALAPDIQITGNAVIASEGSLYVNLDSDDAAGATSGASFRVGRDSPTSSATYFFTITDTGRVGVGKLAPAYELDVAGSAQATVAVYTATAYIGTKVQTPVIDTAAGSLTLQPAAALVLSPGNNQVQLSDGKGFQTSVFVSGFGGSGFRLDQGVTSAGRTALEIDDLTVRGRMSVYELLIRQIRATNGAIFVTSTARVKRVGAVPGGYRLWTTTAEETPTATSDHAHGFLPGDLLRAQRTRWDGSTLQTVYRCDLRVTAADDLYTFRAAHVGGDAPQPGMEFVRIGNTTDVNRQGSIYLTSDDTNAPFLDVINGVSSHDLWNTTGVVKVRVGLLTGVTAQANEYGIIAGSGFGPSGQYIKASNLGVELYNAPLRTYSGPNQTFYLSGDGGTLWLGPSETDKRLHWNGSVLAISGQVTATSGVIAGWSIGSVDPNTISSGSGFIKLINGGSGTARIEVGNGGDDGKKLAGMVSRSTNYTAPVWWAGESFAGMSNAPYRVSLDGTLRASKAILSGSLTAGNGRTVIDQGVLFQADSASYLTDALIRWKDNGNADVAMLGFMATGSDIQGGLSVGGGFTGVAYKNDVQAQNLLTAAAAGANGYEAAAVTLTAHSRNAANGGYKWGQVQVVAAAVTEVQVTADEFKFNNQAVWHAGNLSNPARLSGAQTFADAITFTTSIGTPRINMAPSAGIYTDTALGVLTSAAQAQKLYSGGLMASPLYSASYEARIPSYGIYSYGPVGIGTSALPGAGIYLAVNGNASITGSMWVTGDLYVEDTLYLSWLTTTPTNVTGRIAVWFDAVSQTIKARLPGGAVKTLNWT